MNLFHDGDYGVANTTTTVMATGDNNIDGLLSGYKWASPSLSFSFPDSISDYESNYPNLAIHAAGFQTLNAAQRAAARAWIGPGGEFSKVSLLVGTELVGEGDRTATLRMAMSNHPPTAYGYYPSNWEYGGDSWYNKTSFNTPVIGNYAYHAFGHELGHELGLKHGHETDGVRGVTMTREYDSMEYSIMSYRSYVGHSATGGFTNETWGYAQSLMMYDIRAIQEMYGASFGYNSGNTTYTFSTTTGELFIREGNNAPVGQGTPGANRIFRTIWDGNGIDTYDFSNYSTPITVNLMPGAGINLDTGGTFQRAYLGDGHYARNHVFNALQYKGDPRSLIENATTGSGNDNLVGNGENNILIANMGNDILNGYIGNDRMIGGLGSDHYIVDSSSDVVVEDLNAGIDTVQSFISLVLPTNTEKLLLLGTASNGMGNSLDNVLTGNSSNNVLTGGAGKDTLIGQAGSDDLTGGMDDDVLTGNSGQDKFTFRATTTGLDTITDFSVVDDTIQVAQVGFGGGLVVGATITAAQFRIGAKAGDGSDRFIYNKNTGILLFDQDGIGSVAAIPFAKLSPNLALTHADISVIA